jgi:hypothetical protein
MIKFVLLPLVVIATLATAWFWVAWHWSYSKGERAGWVQKLSDKGWICKTWEGELALVSLPGSTAEKFLFTVHDDEVAKQITKHIGKRVALHYEEKVGLRRDTALRHQRDAVDRDPHRPGHRGAGEPGTAGRFRRAALTGAGWLNDGRLKHRGPAYAGPLALREQPRIRSGAR